MKAKGKVKYALSISIKVVEILKWFKTGSDERLIIHKVDKSADNLHQRLLEVYINIAMVLHQS